MLTRSDLVAPTVQDKNAGNSGDLVKHSAYLALLRELSLLKPDTHRHVVEAHSGKGVYLATNGQLLQAQRLGGYQASSLGLAQTAAFEPPPSGLGAVQGLLQGEVAYAGSAVLHARSVGGACSSLTVLDKDADVRGVVARVFAQPCFSGVRDHLAIEDPGGRSEPEVLSRVRHGAFGVGHIVHLDPFAFVTAVEDERVRSWYLDLIHECDARIGSGKLMATSAFITWGQRMGAAAKEDLDGRGYRGGLPGGYQALVSAVDPSRRVVVTWCWQSFFSLLVIVPAEAKAAVSRAIAADTDWLRPAIRRLEIS